VQITYYGCHAEADSIRITGAVGDTGRSGDDNGFVKSVEDGIGIWK